LLEHVGVPGGDELGQAEEKHFLDLLDPDRPTARQLNLNVTVRIELERRTRRFEHGIPAGKRPEAAVALKTEGRESLLDLGAVGHDDIDVAGEIEASRPVRDREPSDNDGPNLDRPKRSVDDPSDLEHLLRPIGNVGGALKLNSKPVEISAVWMPGHSVASPSTSRPRRRQPWLTIGPSVTGANRSNISARSRSNSARKVGSRNQSASIR
jgi:hypothetical protein